MENGIPSIRRNARNVDFLLKKESEYYQFYNYMEKYVLNGKETFDSKKELIEYAREKGISVESVKRIILDCGSNEDGMVIYPSTDETDITDEAKKDVACRDNTMWYKRSAELESEATSRIIRLFMDDAEKIKTEAPRKLMAQVCSIIRDTYVVAEGEGEADEHQILFHTKEYLDKMIQALNTIEDPFAVPITGNTLDSCIENLSRIRDLSKAESFGSDIVQRLDFFINKLHKASYQYNSNLFKELLIRMGVTVLITCVFLGLLLLLDVDIFNDIPLLVFFIICFFCMSFGELFKDFGSFNK